MAEKPLWGRVAWWYATAMLAGVLCTAVFVAAMTMLGFPRGEMLLSTAHGQTVSLVRDTQWDYDSWAPLLLASRRISEDPTTTPYGVFFEGRAKFQYPPSALWLAEWLPADVIDEALQRWEGSRLQQWNRRAMNIAFLATLAISAVILLVSIRRTGGAALGTRWASTLLVVEVAAAGMTFFPLLISYQLGQMQTTVSAIVAAALLFFLTSRKTIAGGCIGLCCLIKPQYGLMLFWSALRREHAFTAGVLLVLVPGISTSIVQFGLQSHFDYLQVLRVLAERGEAFWYNQSLAGLLHRFVDPGSAVFFTELGAPLPPFRAAIYLASTASAVIVLVAAFGTRLPRTAAPSAQSIDLCAALIAATLASPVAWNHHYGVAFPVFAAVVPILLATANASRVPALLAASYLAIGYVIAWPGPFFVSRWSGLLQSHMLAGGVLLFALLLVARRWLTTAGYDGHAAWPGSLRMPVFPTPAIAGSSRITAGIDP